MKFTIKRQVLEKYILPILKEYKLDHKTESKEK